MVITNMSCGWRCSPSPSSSQPDKDDRGRNVYESPNTVFQFASSGNQLAVRHCVVPPRIETIEHNSRTNSAPKDSSTWNGFQTAAPFFEKSIGEKDRLTLISALAVLEAELHDYQYNMGLLLLERKSWASHCESLRNAAVDAEERLRREDAAHSREMSEATCRDILLRETLDTEKQCTADLERVLRQLEMEAVELKASSNEKLAQVQVALLQVEQKEVLAKSNLHAAEALCAEANRRGTLTEIKLQEIESRELSLKREKQCFTLKLEAHDSEIILEEQSLKEWERKLQEGQARLLQGEKLMNKRETCLNDKDESLRKAEKGVEEKRQAFEGQQAKLLHSTEELTAQLAAEKTREQSLVDRELNVVKREQEMLIRQEQQRNKEREILKIEEDVTNLKQVVENQKEQLQALQLASNLKKKDLSKQTKDLDLMRLKLEQEKICLEERRQRYEATALELQELHRYLETEKETLTKDRLAMEATTDVLERRSKDVARSEQDAARREALLKRREQQAEVTIAKMQREEHSINRKQKNLAAERLNVEENLKAARDDVQCIIKEIESEKEKILKERQKLHRAEQTHQQLQGDISELKAQKERAIAKVEGLRTERVRYAKERKAQEVKANKLKLETEAYQEERKSMSTWLQAEEERLKQEKQDSLDQFQRAVEALLRDKVRLSEEMACKRSEMLSELNDQRQELESNLLSRQQVLEWRLDKERESIRMYYLEKESKLLKEVKQEKEHIRASRESIMQAMKAIKLERILLDRQKQQVSLDNRGPVGHTTGKEKLKGQVTLNQDANIKHDNDLVESPVCIGECSVHGADTLKTPPKECTSTDSPQIFEKFSGNGLAHCVALPTDPPETTNPDREGVKQVPTSDQVPGRQDDIGEDDKAQHRSDPRAAHPATDSPCLTVEGLTGNLDLDDDQHNHGAQDQAMDAREHSKRKRRRSLVIQLS